MWRTASRVGLPRSDNVFLREYKKFLQEDDTSSEERSISFFNVPEAEEWMTYFIFYSIHYIIRMTTIGGYQMIPVKVRDEDKKKLQKFCHTDIDEEERKIQSHQNFLKMCEYNSYIEEDMPEDIECVKGSRKVSEEQFYALLF